MNHSDTSPPAPRRGGWTPWAYLGRQGPAAVSAITSVRPRISYLQPPADLQAAERAAFSFLSALGVDLSSEATAETPRRMARAYAEMLAVPSFDMTTFPNDQGYDELVVVESIPLRSLCEHHMLPFTGTAHIGYLPSDRILGLSKFARLVAFFAEPPPDPGTDDQADRG